MPAAGLGEDLELYVWKKGKSFPIGGSEGVTPLNETIENIELERTITGASVVTVRSRDPEHILQREGIYEEEPPAEAKIDGLDFVACSFSKKADEYELTFEDREFYLLSQDHKYRSAERKNGMTRAEFIKSVCHAVVPHAPFVCLELTKEQPKEGPKAKARKVKGKVVSGVTAGSIKISGQSPDPDQLNNINTVLQVCEELKAPPNARLAILCAGIAESTFRTHDLNKAEGANGVFQLIPSTAASTGLSPFNTKACAEHWLKTGFTGKGGGIALANAGQSVGEIAKNVENANASAEDFEKHRAEAEEILSVGGSGGTNPADKVEEVTHQFAVNKGGSEDENTLQGLERLAEEVKWRFFISKGTIYYLQDATLAMQKPSLELDEDSPGVLDIQWELEKKETKKPSVITIECRAQLWESEIGDTVRFKPTVGKYISEGNWIVSTIERKDITDNGTFVKVTRPRAAIVEKAQFTNVKAVKVVKSLGNPTGGIQETSVGTLHEKSVAWQIYQQAKWISEQGFYYLYGGGHDGFMASPINSKLTGLGEVSPVESSGLDCSGAVSWALHSAGAWPGPIPPSSIPPGPMTTERLKREWGEAGKGEYVTLWVIDSAKQDHCFLWIQIPSSKRPEGGPEVDYAFEASHTGATIPKPHGVGLRPRLEYYANPESFGFEARHWPGT